MMINKKQIQYTALDTVILFLIVLPSFLRCKAGIFPLVLFLFLAFIISTGTVILIKYIFNDMGKSFWSILLPFCILSVIANSLFNIISTFPFIIVAVTAVFSKKIAVLKKNSEKSQTSIKFHPYFTVFLIVFAAYTALYSIAGVL